MELYRIRGWLVRDADRIPRQRTHAVAHDIRELVYSRLAPNILTELESRVPEPRRNSVRFHQLLSPDLGHPALKTLLAGLLALMRLVPDGEFGVLLALVNRSFPKFDSQQPLFPETIIHGLNV